MGSAEVTLYLERSKPKGYVERLKREWLAMKLDVKEQEGFRQYLLGELPQEHSERLEERLMVDSESFEELLIAEDELIDQYLDENLSPAKRLAFENHFLAAPERQNKVRFARSLKKYVHTATKPGADLEISSQSKHLADESNPTGKRRRFFSFVFPDNKILSYSTVSALFLLVLGASWILIRNWNPSPHKPVNVLAVALTSGSTRDGGEIKRIKLPPGVDTLRLQLELPANQYESFRAALLTEERREVWAQAEQRLVANSNRIDFDVPSQLLQPGDYQLKVSGRLANGEVQDIDRFLFRVLK